MSWFHDKLDKKFKSSTGPSKTLSASAGGSTSRYSNPIVQSQSSGPSPIPSRSPDPDVTRAAAQTASVIKQPRDLWKEAFDSLAEDQRSLLQEGANGDDRVAITVVESVIERTETEYKDYCARGWHLKKGDKTKETNVRIRAKEILCSALQFKDIIDQGLKFDPSGYGTTVWGVVSGALQLLQHDTDRVEAVFDSAAEMAKIISKYAVVEAQYRDKPLQEQAAFEDRIVAVYSALLMYAAEARKGLDKSLAGRFLASFWSIENQTINSLHTSLTKKDGDATDILHIVAHQQRKLEFAKLEEQAVQSLDRIDNVVRKLLEAEKVRILGWLSEAKPSDRQQSLRLQVERDNSKSGQWFLTSPEFSNWLRDPGSFLWLNGVSGCGKSSLCSTIIKSLTRSDTISRARILAYWYFDNGDLLTQDLRELLRFFLRQIAAAIDVLPAPVRTLAAKHESPGSNPEITELYETLCETISGLEEEVLLIIDAIDEYPAVGTIDQRQDLLTVVSDLVQAQLPKLHLCVTSIEERDILDSFHSLNKPPVELDVEPLLFEDVDSFVDASIARMARSKPWWTEDIKNNIRNTLKADDYKRFRIVALQLGDLSKCFDEQEIDVTLNSIPHTVEELYERRLGQVAQKDIPRLRHIFYWVSLSSRRMSLKELAAAPGVNLRNPDDIFVICPRGMVMKEERLDSPPNGQKIRKSNTEDDGTSSPPDLDGAGNEIVIFDHPSVKRFLHSQKLFESNGGASCFFIPEKDVHVELTKYILDYMLTIKAPQISASFLESHPFLSYAANNFISHLRITAAENAGDTQIAPLLFDLFKAPMQPGFLNWMRIADPLKVGHGYDLNENDCPSPLYVAIALRLRNVVDHLVEAGSFINSTGIEHLTALNLAIAQKNYNLALKLVEKGADPNQSSDQETTPLYLAIQAGVEQLVQVLLTSGAKIDHTGGKYGSALQMACYYGNLEIVKMLIKQNADVNAEGGLFGTALQAAAAAGHNDVTAILLEYKARPGVFCGALGNAFQAAITGGHSSIVQQLAYNNVAFDATGDSIWTEAFSKFESERSGRESWSSLLANDVIGNLRELPRTQQLLACALKLLRDLPSYAEKRVNRSSGYKASNQKSSKGDLEKLIDLCNKTSKIGLQGMDRIGFHAKAIFHAAVCHCLFSIIETSTKPQFHDDFGIFAKVSEIIFSRRTDQTVIENDNSEVYATAKIELTKLYTLGFKAIAMFLEMLGKTRMLRFLTTFRSQKLDSVKEQLQLLLDQDQRFMSAMMMANTFAVSAQTTDLQSRIAKELRNEIERNKSEADERLAVALRDMEQRILDTLRKTLSGMIREEIDKALQEKGAAEAVARTQ